MSIATVAVAPGASAPAPAPIDADQRLHAPDILRGLALFGMILVHFHQKTRVEVAGLEDLIGWGVWIFLEQKAWGIFAFLFGVGFAVLLRRLEARGAAVAPIYLRRLAMLAVFGMVAEVGFGFHILFEYACWGVALLVVRRWSTRTLLVTAALAACARPVAAELAALHAWWVHAAPAGPAATAALSQAVQAAARQGHYATLLSARWALFVRTLVPTWRQLLPSVNLALFILGLLAVRHRIFDQPRHHVRLIAGGMAFGALSWAAAWLLLRRIPELAVPGARWPLEAGLGIIHDQWLCLTYIGAVVLLLAYRPEWTGRLAMFGSAGRMALTNYMVQAAMLDLLASEHGAGLKLRPLAYVPAAMLLFGIEAAASAAWLARYRYGPLEWVWRTVTYARAQPLRLPARTAPS
jgi:uncharacterized protein